MAEPARPLLVYDGDCGFCLRWVTRWKRRTAGSVDYAPYQEVAGRFPGLGPDDFRRSVWLIEPDGRRSRAAEAVARSLARAPGGGGPLRLYEHVPGVRPLCEAAYGFVARHRTACLRVERLLLGPDVLASTWQRSRALFRTGLALVAAIAVVSLWVQIDGLIGSRGIVPVAQALEAAAERSGVDPDATALGPWAWESGVLLRHPTLFWFARSDGALHAACGLALLAALLMLLDVAPALCALVLWAVYLSLVHAGGVFLGFQWDSLLVETCLLAALYLPWRLRPARPARGRPDREPSAPARLLVWWLLFRFMFESGVVKLTWGDPTWRDLTALTYHYATQPLPHVVSVWASRLPLIVHLSSAFGVFAIEMGLAFLIFTPRRPRAVVCAAFVGLQVLIGGTGNYGFFNLLTVVLALTLLDDHALAALGRALGRALRPRRWGAKPPAADALPALPPLGRREPPVKRLVIALCAVPVLAVGALQVRDALRPGTRVVPSGEEVASGAVAALLESGPVAATRVLEARLAPFLSVNAYGLFRVMTTSRPEIVVRGTLDGETWVEYDFRWKPDALDEPPHWVQPHMPRLDWRLWFEALSWEPAARPLRPYRPSPWFLAFLVGLAQGEPAVLDLLETDPFDGRPPLEVQASLFLYGFAGTDQIPPDAEQGRWWRRQQIYPYWLPVRRQDVAGTSGAADEGRPGR